MNEEEKQAIETFKHWIEYEKNNKEKINKADELISMQECILGIIDKQQKEIERLKKESIGNTKYERLLFSIRMLHFHNYVNDKQFAEMIKKLSNENKGE